MKIPLYQSVALKKEIPDFGLKPGDIGTLIDYVPHPSGGEEGCVLEVFNAIGESIAVFSVGESEIEPLEEDEVLAVRRLAKAC